MTKLDDSPHKNLNYDIPLKSYREFQNYVIPQLDRDTDPLKTALAITRVIYIIFIDYLCII